jgi:hypothetical protein
MTRVTRHNNFTYLTGALILLLLVAGLVQSLPGDAGRAVLDLLTILIFFVAVKSLSFGPNWSRFVWTLTGAIVITVILHAVFGWKGADYIQLLLMLALFVATTAGGFRQVLFQGDIDFNKVVGSIALFILIGLTWTVLYLLMLEMDPEAFKGMTQLPWEENFSQAAYFSFVTLTTLGYGDISPANRFVEVLVYIEAIVGVFYMAGFVASLINAAQRGKSEQQ